MTSKKPKICLKSQSYILNDVFLARPFVISRDGQNENTDVPFFLAAAQNQFLRQSFAISVSDFY
jgi:hypothetical protein